MWIIYLSLILCVVALIYAVYIIIVYPKRQKEMEKEKNVKSKRESQSW